MTEKKKYLITGITGFAGSNLAKLMINRGYNVHGLIRGSNGREYDLLDIMSSEELNKIKFHYGDLKDYQTIRRILEDNQFDGIFHLGAQGHPPTSFKDPVGTIETNVLGTVNLIDNIQRIQPDCILENVSTCEVYGNAGKDGTLLTEETPMHPLSPYNSSKAMVEIYFKERCENKLIRGFSTRAFSHTGPRRGKNFSISWDAYHIALLKKGIPIKDIQPINKNQKIDPFKSIPVGNLKTKRIVIDVKDCMRAYLDLMQSYDDSMRGEAYNICGMPEDIKEMEYYTDILIKASGLEGIIKVPDKRVFRPIDIQVQIGDTTKIKDKINWKPEISIENETLPSLLKYWEDKIGN